MLNFKILIPLTVLAMSMFSATATGIPSQTRTESSPARPTLRLVRQERNRPTLRLVVEEPIPANRHAPAPVRLARRVALDPTNLPGGFSVGDAVYATGGYVSSTVGVANIAWNEVGVVQGPSTEGDPAYLFVLFSGTKRWNVRPSDISNDSQYTTCPEGHQMEPSTGCTNYHCDVCKARKIPAKNMVGCRQCNWDVCNT